MNLLLILSALLSVLTGVSSSVRAPTVAQAVGASECLSTQAAIAPRTISRRPVATPATLIETARSVHVATFALPSIEPLFATRRRE